MDVCNCDAFSVVNVYHDHLKFCILMVEGLSVVVRFLSFLLLGMCACVVSVLLWPSLVCM